MAMETTRKAFSALDAAVAAASLAAALAAAGCAGTGAPEAMRQLSLTSYNIRHCGGPDGAIDFQKVADVILHEKPDFVGLNEVDCRTKRSGGVDEAAELGRLTGLHATFGKAIPYGGGAYGNAVLSREKPISVVTVPLPGKEPRVLLLCEFRDFWFGTMHLDFGVHQLPSVEAVRGVVAEKSKDKPVFVTGDWNATPDSKTLGAMRGFMKVLSKEDCLSFHGYSRHRPGHVYCIDYIAVDSAHAGCFAVRDAHATSRPDVSDHNPISVSLDFTGTVPAAR